jgi:hypothetical protein
MPHESSLLVFLLWPLALGGWIWGSVQYFPWWLSRYRGDQIKMDGDRLKHILVGYGAFVIALTSIFLIRE